MFSLRPVVAIAVVIAGLIAGNAAAQVDPPQIDIGEALRAGIKTVPSADAQRLTLAHASHPIFRRFILSLWTTNSHRSALRVV